MDKEITEIEFEKLEYYSGKEMKLQPVNLNIETLAEDLKAGRPVVAILEPGDATRYRLLIVPCSSVGWLSDVGIPSHEEHRYLMVTKFGDRGGEMFFATEQTGPWNTPFEDEWSKSLVTWWVRQLWKVISHCEK